MDEKPEERFEVVSDMEKELEERVKALEAKVESLENSKAGLYHSHGDGSWLGP